MTDGLSLQECKACGRRYLPARLLCQTCGGARFRTVRARTGILEEVTRLERAFGRDLAVNVGSVRIDDGPVVIARVTAHCEPGERVSLCEDAGVAVASPR